MAVDASKLLYMTHFPGGREMMDSEPELERRYADLTMIIRPDMRHGKIFDVVIEFKFLTLKDLGLSGETVRKMPEDRLHGLPRVASALREGHAQGDGICGAAGPKVRKSETQTFCGGFPWV